jgi:hypothetical protein
MLQKTDKACGKSFISEGQQCSKPPISRPKATTNANLTRHLLTAGGLAVAGGMLAGVYAFQEDIKGSALPPEAVCPKEPPAGLYDSFKPGDLIYTTFEMAGGHRAHYSVYLGKEDGKHMVIHATAHNEGGKDLGSWLKKESFDSYNPDYSFRKATRSDKAGMVPSTEQLHKLANDLNGRNFKWNGFESNCESFARSLTNDIPESLQGKNASKLNKAIVAGIVRTTVGRGWDRSNAATNEEVWAKMKQTTKLDAMIDPKERAERILSPLFNNRPVSVMFVSLTPEGIPTGVFKGMVTPGISRYYTFKMGNQIEYKRIMPKGDGLTKTHKVMREFKEGALTTHGKPVTSRKQAIAIALSEQARVKRKKRTEDKTDAVPYGIWYKNRTTPVVVNAESSEEARSKGSDRRKESYGAITAVKALKGADARAARRGDWVRTRASGKSPEESTQKSKIRPQFFDAEDPCWEGYEQVGMKRKGGKMVPNCVPAKKKADAILEHLDKKCGGSGIPDGAKCHKGEGAAQKGTPERNQKAAELKAERWRQKNPKKAFLLNLSLAVGTYAAIGAIQQAAANRMAENYIKKDFGVSAEEAQRVRKTVQQKHRREGRASAEQYYREYAQEHAERRAKEGSKKNIDKNWHKTLGVSPDASGAEIKAAFRKKAKASHPDIPGGSNEAYLKVQKAWESAQATGKFKRGDSIEMEGFLRRLDAICCKQCEDDEMDVKRKADELLARLDQKCGNSGIPDGAKCRKGTGGFTDPEDIRAYQNSETGSVEENKAYIQKTKDDFLRKNKERKAKEKAERKLATQAFVGVGGILAAHALSKAIANNHMKKAENAGSTRALSSAKDNADSLLSRLDVKCGKGAISFGEKCHSSAVMGAIAMGSAAINSQGFERSVMSHHAVSQNEAREFGRSLSVVHERGGAEKAKEHYSAWAKNVVTMAKKVA